MIHSREEFAAEYYRRCLTTDNFIVMKSPVAFNVGDTFNMAASPGLGWVNESLIVLAESSADEAASQAKRVMKLNLGPRDLSSPFYYRIGTKNRHWAPQLRDGKVWPGFKMEFPKKRHG